MTIRLTCAGDVHVRRALRAGAEAYLKTALHKELFETIRGVYAGKKLCYVKSRRNLRSTRRTPR